MSNPRTPSGGFTPSDIKALRALAVLLAAVVGGIAVFVKSSDVRLLAVMSTVGVMALCPLLLYFYRRRQSRK